MNHAPEYPRPPQDACPCCDAPRRDPAADRCAACREALDEQTVAYVQKGETGLAAEYLLLSAGVLILLGIAPLVTDHDWPVLMSLLCLARMLWLDLVVGSRRRAMVLNPTGVAIREGRAVTRIPWPALAEIRAQGLGVLFVRDDGLRYCLSRFFLTADLARLAVKHARRLAQIDANLRRYAAATGKTHVAAEY